MVNYWGQLRLQFAEQVEKEFRRRRLYERKFFLNLYATLVWDREESYPSVRNHIEYILAKNEEEKEELVRAIEVLEREAKESKRLSQARDNKSPGFWEDQVSAF